MNSLRVTTGVVCGALTIGSSSLAAGPADAAAKASKRVANGACNRAELNARATLESGQVLACQRVGSAYRWRIVAPRHGDPCTQRAANYPGTALDCVVVPGDRLQWRTRGTLRNPFRLNEPTETYSFEGSRYRVVLTQWNPDITEVSRSLGVDAAVPGVAFVAWRVESTLLASSKPTNADRASEASVPFAYVVTDGSREDQTVGLTDRTKPGSQPDLAACRNGAVQNGFPDPGPIKERLEKLQVGETGYDEWCKEAPTDKTSAVVLESNSWFTRPELNAKYAISVYFTGTPR